MEAKYTHKKMDSVTVERVLKDGHTMFIEDTVKDLNRKSYLEAENKQLKAQLKQEQLCGDQLQEKCDNLRADRMELEASNKRLTDALGMTTPNLATENKQLKTEISNLKFKLKGADKVMEQVDDAALYNRLSARSGIADARLNYGRPFKYEFDISLNQDEEDE